MKVRNGEGGKRLGHELPAEGERRRALLIGNLPSALLDG
jgi:hypothetical protein